MKLIKPLGVMAGAIGFIVIVSLYADWLFGLTGLFWGYVCSSGTIIIIGAIKVSCVPEDIISPPAIRCQYHLS